MSVNEARLRALIQAAPQSQEALLNLLLQGLDWPLPDGVGWADIELPWSPEELHLDPAKVAHLTQISQIPPLTPDQDFGVFVLGFEGGRLPIGAVRRLVQRLVTNERGRTGGGKIPTWDLNNLVFFCLSDEDQSTLHVVNFREDDGKKVLRVLSWSDRLTPTRLDLLVRRGAPDLFWQTGRGPAIVLEAGFGTAFTGYREGIRSAKALSKRMAEVAQDVRDEVTALFEVETETGPMRTLYRDVRDQLLGDITPERFADVYAQTMVYGLLTARIAHPEQFQAEQSLAVMRFDNEFLDAIYARFRDGSDSVVDVDELGLADLAEQLAETDVDELLADFGADNQRDDPVVYFYEEFLAQYDPDQRRDLGAFYTPKPVVRYIVKTVDDALKSFGLPLGVADPTSWAEYVAAHPDIEVPSDVKPEDAVVSMFDPANGTGTFLVEWMNQARRNAGEAGVATALHHASALEISLASYAVSHLKVSLDLPEELRHGERLPVFLGDTLGKRRLAVFDEMADPISAEGTLADQVKYDRHHNVLIGNPPYDRVESQGTGGFVTSPDEGSRSLFDDIYKPAVENTNFAHVASLYNLYVYFWRWAIWKVFEENDGPGVISMITASSWLDGPGFLGLRKLAREVADEIIVVDLHGNNKGARRDENVFDIETPVAIVTLVRRGQGNRSTPAHVRYTSYWGTRAEKLAALADLAAGASRPVCEDASADWHAPFVPVAGGHEWSAFPALTDLFPWQQPGCKFGRTWPISTRKDTLVDRWDRLISSTDLDDRKLCFVNPSSGRTVTSKVGKLDRIIDLKPGAAPRPIVRYGYRSFDRQWAFEDPRMAKTESPSLWASQSSSQVFMLTKTTHSFGAGPAGVVSAFVPDLDAFYGSEGGKDVVPLYRDAQGTPNVDPKLMVSLASQLGQSVTPEHLFAYAFGVLAGTDYTRRFSEALETPGPRVPLTSDPTLFTRMAAYGRRLLWLQTFGERFSAGNDRIPFAGVKWTEEPTRLPRDKGEVHYDVASGELRVADGTLVGVTPDVWEFEVSGLAVLQKWLTWRMVKPAGKAGSSRSPLDKIRPTAWSAEWTTELVEIVAVLRETVRLQPAGVALLEEIVAGPLIAADELPPVAPELRQPPKVKPGQTSGREDLMGMLPKTDDELF